MDGTSSVPAGQVLPRRAFLLAGMTGAMLLGTGGLASATGSTQAPEIVDCAGWGARPPKRAVTVRQARPVRILVHHTATANVPDLSRGAADHLARSVQRVHMDNRGWIDSGQHFTISRGGFVLEGRHRSLETLGAGARMVEGAHCTGQNTVSLGIENEGLYEAEDPPQVLWDRLRALCALMCRQYGIAPAEIYGHRDFRNTACPGQRLYDQLPRLRQEVAAELGVVLGAAEANKAHWPVLAEGATGDLVLAAQYLLRAAGHPVLPDGEFSSATRAAVLHFQHATGAQDVTGVLGGESWPVLVAAARPAENADAARAVETLTAGRETESVPDEPTAADWQRVLGTDGAPVPEVHDPPGTADR